MRKKPWLALAVFTLAAVAVVGLAVYREPRVLERLYPEIDLAGCEGISLRAYYYPEEVFSSQEPGPAKPYCYEYSVFPGDPAFD